MRCKSLLGLLAPGAAAVVGLLVAGCGSDAESDGSGGSGGGGGSGANGGNGGAGAGSSFPNCGTVTDVEGNVYDTVQIGSQCWMKTNLRTATYRDGTPIPNQTELSFWADFDNRDGAWCHYDNDPAHDPDWGKLYNGFALSSKLCPSGWRVPSGPDFSVLLAHAGEHPAAGAALTATDGSWTSGATDAFGFSALPSGRRGITGEFEDGQGTAMPSADFWTTSPTGNGDLDNSVVWIDPFGIIGGGARHHQGLSVRCVQGEQYPLEEGFYTSETTTVSSTCGGFSFLGGQWTLEWDYEDYFTLTGINGVVDCLMSTSTCSGYNETNNDDPEAVIDILLSEGPLTIHSQTSFSLARTATFNCFGLNCDLLAQLNDATFPCSADYIYDYELSP